MHRPRLHTVALIVLAALACAAPAAASGVRRIGVVVTTRVNVPEDQARALSSALGAVIHKHFPVDVIAGAETERRLPPGGVSARCVADIECRQDLGRRLDADELILLVMVGAGGRIQIDPTWVHVASGEVTSRSAIEIADDADVREVLAEVAPSLLPHIPERKQREERDGPNVVVVTPSGTTTTTADSGRRITAGTLIAAGVSAGALAGATVFTLSSGRKFDSLDRDGCRAMPCSKAEIDSLRRDTILADVLFGVSAVAAGTAIVLYLLDDGEPTPAREAPQVSIGTGPGTVGLSLGGVF